MQDAPGLSHARSRKDDHRFVTVIKGLGFLDRAYVLQAGKIERGSAVLADEFARLLIKVVRMSPEDVAGIDGQRAVHIDGQMVDLSRGSHAVEIKHQLLRAADGT